MTPEEEDLQIADIERCNMKRERDAEDRPESPDLKKSKTSDDDDDHYDDDDDEEDQDEKYRYRKTWFFTFDIKYLKKVTRNIDRLWDHKMDRSIQAAYEYHKYKLGPWLNKKSDEREEFQSNKELDELTETLNNSPDLEKFANDAFKGYKTTDGKQFKFFFKRAIWSDYYDEEWDGCQTKYQSDSD
jgi:ABC-type Zn2+ transport system substrate-binding protein/surface adhesin